jgi:hypothetical protein
MTPDTHRPAIFVSSFFPMPQDRGDPLRVLMLMRAIAKRGNATFLVCLRDSTSESDVAALQAELPGCSILAFRPDYRKSPLGKVRVWLRATRTATPVWVVQRHSDALTAEIRRRATSSSLIFLAGEAAGAYAISAPRGAAVHWDKSNTIGVSSASSYRAAVSRRGRLRRMIVHILSLAFETRVLSRADSVSVTSNDEARRVVDLYGCEPEVWPSTVRASVAPPTPDLLSSRILWLGSLNYAPNTDGLTRFLSEARARLSASELTVVVVGSGGTDTLREHYEAYECVEYLGFVEDLSTLVAGCRAGVVPLWDGAGVKLKTVTMMSLGLPVASTHVGLEGLPPDAALGVSDDPAGLVDIIVTATPDRLDDARTRGLGVLAGQFSRDGIETLIAEYFGDSEADMPELG